MSFIEIKDLHKKYKDNVVLNGINLSIEKGNVIGKGVGDTVQFGGLLGYAPIMPVNQFDCSAFVNRGGRIPAPIHSFKN